MLRIFLCEDDPQQLKQLKTTVTDYIALKDYDIELALTVNSPAMLLDYLDTQPQRNALYILDVDLSHEMNGIELGGEIRERDPYGKIIFVTTHEEMIPLTFRHRVEALDYITKDRPGVRERVEACIELAYRRYQDDVLEKPYFQIKTGETMRNIPIDEIMFFESDSHKARNKVILHMANGNEEFYGSISEAAEASPDFYRCHQSYVVNVKNVKCVYRPKKMAEMVNGEFVLVASRKITDLLEAMQK